MDEDLYGKPKAWTARTYGDPKIEEQLYTKPVFDHEPDAVYQKRSKTFFDENEAKNKFLQDMRLDVDELQRLSDPHQVLVSTEPKKLASVPAVVQKAPVLPPIKVHTSFLPPKTIQLKKT